MRPIDKIRNQDLPRGQGDHSTLYMSLELSRSTWLVTSLSPNSDKMSKRTIAAGDASKLLALLARLRGRAEQLIGGLLNVAVIQEAGLDGFWVHRSLEANDIESHVVDPASIAVSRRRRCAKTDAIDGETLLRTFLAWKRGEPRVCEMVVPPTPEQEDHRRLSRERANLFRRDREQLAVGSGPGRRELSGCEQNVEGRREVRADRSHESHRPRDPPIEPAGSIARKVSSRLLRPVQRRCQGAIVDHRRTLQFNSQAPSLECSCFGLWSYSHVLAFARRPVPSC